VIVVGQDIPGSLQGQCGAIVILAQVTQQQNLQAIAGALFNHLGAFGVFQVAVVPADAGFQVVRVEGIVLEQVRVVVAFQENDVEITQRPPKSRKTMAKVCKNAYAIAAVVDDKSAGVHSIVGCGDGVNGYMAQGDAVAGDEILELGWADFAKPVSHNVVGIARAENRNLEFALENAGAGCVVGVIVGDEQPIEALGHHAITRHTFLGTLEGDARIKDEPDIAGFIEIAVAATA